MGRATHIRKLKERNLRVMYKLKVSKDPISMNMPHEEEFDDDSYESIASLEQRKYPLVNYEFDPWV